MPVGHSVHLDFLDTISTKLPSSMPIIEGFRVMGFQRLFSLYGSICTVDIDVHSLRFLEIPALTVQLILYSGFSS